MCPGAPSPPFTALEGSPAQPGAGFWGSWGYEAALLPAPLPGCCSGSGMGGRASGCWGCLPPLSCCSPLQRGRPRKQLRFVVGLLRILTSDCVAATRQRLCVYLGYLLQMRGEESGRFPALLSLILPPFLAWYRQGPTGPCPSPGREGGGNVLGGFCAPTLLALCLPVHPRKDPWERVTESQKSPAEHKRANQFAARSKLGREEGSELQDWSVLQRVVFDPFPLQAAGSAGAEEVTGRFPASQRPRWPVQE